MTKETETKVMHEAFNELRCKAVARMKSIVGEDIEDTWDGVMDAADKVKEHGDCKERFEFALAAMQWTHGFLETWTYERLEKAEELIAVEKSAEESGAAKPPAR